MRSFALSALIFSSALTWAGDDFRSLTNADMSELAKQMIVKLLKCGVEKSGIDPDHISNKTSESVDKTILTDALNKALGSKGESLNLVLESKISETKKSFHVEYV